MSEFISGKEALIALANGNDVEVRHPRDKWYENWESLNGSGGKFFLLYLLDESIGYQFRLKPRTININGVEVPAPDRIEANPNLHGGWAINIGSEYYMYKSESNYNIVVAALRSVFGKK